MADERRTSRRADLFHGRPGRPAAGRSGPRYAERLKADRKRAAREREAVRLRVRDEERKRSRLTGRAAILVLVLAVLAVSYASSLRAYLQQRSHLDDLQAQISERESNIADLRLEKRRWEDPAYVAQQARERFGFVLRGDTPFVVVDADGNPLDSTGGLSDPAEVADPDKQTWYESAWDSMKIAGDPPTRVPDPKDQIKAPKEDLAE